MNMALVSGRLVLYLVVSLFADGFALPSGEIGESTERILIAMREEVNEIKAQMRALVGESLDQKRAVDELYVRARRDAETPDNPTGTESPTGQCYVCPPGPAGLPGRDGRDGRDAISGCPGNERPNSTVGGVVYTRWGRSECPEGSDLVYHGVSGGSHFTHKGSGSNYLCMPLEPVYDEYSTASGEPRGLLYGGEYETSKGINRLKPRHDHTPVCAVCRAPPGRTTKLMIPARNDCPSEEWRKEYSGYLMSAYFNHVKSTEFVCFDYEMEAEPGTYGNQQGALFYMVEVFCRIGGGLPCLPYKHGRELTCAVCTI